ncbi:hypothetical protein TUM19329_09840 [Legionella antarctica]|uniref:Saframycin Mx1 synthetase B n=1 Tax=Legionella antarctica TaxID=2708020 RepID=A0A6F8T339_9GAMM|nr:AMP-binding protein [Legionella antarctica]BCA94623.1 hypothetical protein TUM19329_09840 [Legionella antarctica]
MNNVESIIDRLIAVTEKRANYEALHHYNSDEDERLSYQQLYLEVRKLAFVLKEKIQPGDRVLILLHPGMDYILSFLACMYNGAIAVPCPQPVNATLATKILNIIADCTPSLILIDSHLDLNPDKKPTEEVGNYHSLLSEIAQHPIFSVDRQVLDQVHPIIEPVYHPIAFLQYTSGSTSFPKGVINLHSNVLHNIQLGANQLQLSSSPCHMGSWLPPYHDMGLIAMILTALLTGSTLHFMSPYMFIHYPQKWLQMITDHHIRYSAAPNFGYAYCVEKIKENHLASLDLSPWEIAICGAEFIHKKTFEVFFKKFSSAGFKKTAFTPGYGLAEATVFVSTEDVINPPAFKEIIHNGHAKLVACCGKPLMDTLIANPDTQEILDEKQEGEILLQSKSITPGYWNNSAPVDRGIFHEIKGITYLKTGDLGMMENEKLYVFGRLKELIIINGVNHFPTDFENSIIMNIEGLNPGHVVAFAEEQNSKEHLSVALANPRKISLTNEELADKVEKIIESYHAVRPLRIYILKNSAIPKTSSGKIQRLKLAQGVKTGDIDSQVIIDNSIGEKTENSYQDDSLKDNSSLKQLAKIAASILRLKDKEKLSFDAPLKNLGFDSIHFAELMTQASQYFRQDEHKYALERLGLQSNLRDISTYMSLDRQEKSTQKTTRFCSRIENINKIKDYHSSLNIKLKDKVFCNPYESAGSDTIILRGEAYINFGSFNYLGLADHPQIIKQVKAAIDQYGTSASASRLVAGDRLITQELEQAIAKHIGVEEALIYNSGYDTNFSTIACLCGADDLILYDA